VFFVFGPGARIYRIKPSTPLRLLSFSSNARDAYMSFYNIVLAAAVIVLVGLLFVMRKKSEA
jgi:hypothetical protein